MPGGRTAGGERRPGVFSGESSVGPATAAPCAGAMLVGEGLTQREVGDVAGISEVTIRDRYTELLEVAGVMTDGELAGVGSG
ncbi:hypothetical protein [Haloglomus irregulare]|uniref:hypothetical protein n=1 Tax=Haloglomus irregulare TaxID=2234134 RepID=UPI001186B6D3|nr:hypothetical protein [Haloglomus irregulare]